MREKSFDPISKLAGGAGKDSISAHIRRCSVIIGDIIDNIKSKVEKSKDDIER